MRPLASWHDGPVVVRVPARSIGPVFHTPMDWVDEAVHCSVRVKPVPRKRSGPAIPAHGGSQLRLTIKVRAWDRLGGMQTNSGEKRWQQQQQQQQHKQQQQQHKQQQHKQQQQR